MNMFIITPYYFFVNPEYISEKYYDVGVQNIF